MEEEKQDMGNDIKIETKEEQEVVDEFVSYFSSQKDQFLSTLQSLKES